MHDTWYTIRLFESDDTEACDREDEATMRGEILQQLTISPSVRAYTKAV